MKHFYKKLALSALLALPLTAQAQDKAKDPDFVPQWAKTVVWYQIFPERFRNGDPNNDPKLADIKGAYPEDQSSPWQLSPWGADWYELQSHEKANGKGIWYNIQRRRYGGDLQGIIDQLDYIKSLGIGAIYLNPIFVSPSLHKYDGASYHHVEPTFGPDPEGDKKLMAQEDPTNPSTWVWTAADKLALKLIDEVHKRGIKIIFDGVFNHMGINSFAFQDVLANQQNSKYKDWFTVKSWNDPGKGTKFDYEGWFGVKTLPELKEDANGIVSGPKEYIFAATRRWMAPNGEVKKGIDGWRLDVAFCVAHPFWKDWRKLVKSINPEAYTTAEVIDSNDKVKPYVTGDEFDAVMNYNFAFTTAEYFVCKKTRISTSEFDKRLRVLRNSFPSCVNYVMQNLFDSHDTNRFGSHVVNKDLGQYRDWGNYFGVSQVERTAVYNTRKPNPEEYQIQKLFALFQMTYLGAPMIYYGDEVGMWGANDPDCRKPMVWSDLQYQDETHQADGTERATPDKVEVNRDLLAHYQKLTAIRNQYPALQLGDFQTLLTDNKKEVYAFSRNYQGQTVIVVINNSEQAQQSSIKADKGSEWKDKLNKDQLYKATDGKIVVNIPAKGGVILVK